jgi:hypothetical protein
VVVGAAVGIALALAGGGGGNPTPTPTSPVASTKPPAVTTEKQAVAEFDRQLAAALPGSGLVPPSVFPRFAQDLDTLGQTTGKVAQALAARADQYALQSGSAVRGIRAIDVAGIVPGSFASTRADLGMVRSELLAAMQRYQDAASLMQRAVTSENQRSALVARARSAEQEAAAQYRKGYSDLTAVWRSVGIPVPSPSPTPSPVPSKTHAPSPRPTATKASPKPTHSGGGGCVGNICITPIPTPTISIP